MASSTKFLSENDEQEIVAAITLAEKQTSGEIRVHIEEASSKLPYERAKEIFEMLGMHQTELKNGVLFYVCIRNKKFALLGDKGIHEKVGTTFWDTTKNIVLENFKMGRFKEGLVAGITSAGEQLRSYFPYDEVNDSNELSNEISKS
ncbi:MAG: hypothetical protein RLY43_2488 [Bacteroidota bacterium]|jgi:uncharacterized membrane protein